jgi:hypothetical protein
MIIIVIIRRRVEYDLIDTPFLEMSEEDLRSFILQMQQNSPLIGESLVTGRLISLGYNVIRERVCQALRSVNPFSSALR